MSQAWDTTTAARLRPDSRALAYATGALLVGEKVAFTASTLNEISYGLHKAAMTGSGAAEAQLHWLRAQILAGLLDILAFDDRAADLAGCLRARMPSPPSFAKAGRRRSKANERVAWIIDLQTAATAFVHGYDLATADAHHSVIAAELSALAPGAPPLSIHPPPRF
jgi:predicted nucleic acid-binding protein